MRVCPECGGEFKEQRITHDERHGGKLYTFQNVPAWVCSQCGSAYLDSEVIQAIEALIGQRKEPEKYEQVPVFDLLKAGLKS